MAKWEYEVIPLVTKMREIGLETQKEVLNKYALEGWESVSTATLQIGNAFDIIAYLRREKK